MPRKAGIDRLAPHDLRRTFARLCHTAGGKLGLKLPILRSEDAKTKMKSVGNVAGTWERFDKQHPRNGHNAGTAACLRTLTGKGAERKRMMDAERQSPIIDDDGFFPTLMPNLMRTRQVRLVAWFLCFWGITIGIYAARIVGVDLYVRSHWTVVEGDIIKFDEKSASTGSIRSRALTYWNEFEVEFNPKQSGCKTEMSWAVEMPFQCIGTVKSPGSRSLSIARSWAYRHPVGSPAKFYYNPATGHLRFAGESILDLYPWGAILAFLVAGGAGVILLRASGHRLKQLKTSTADSGTTPIVVENTESNELIDLKLR